MSNPAVFELAQANIAGQKICIEDNIGESIHLHIGLVRFDMTVKEFREFAKTLQGGLNAVTPKFFDVNEYDAYFIERLAADLMNISAVEEILLPLADLKICYEGEDDKILTVNLTESPVFKYYSGESIDLEQFENKGDIFQSNSERADKVFAAVKDNPNKNFKICVDESNRILDGYLTSAAMARLYGANFKIKASRFSFETLDALAIVRRRNKKLW